MYKHFRRPCWVTQFRMGSLHGKVERHLRLPTRERSRASFPQRSMTSLPRCNSQSPQQQEPYESQSASCWRDRLCFATCCWIGSEIKSSLRIAGFTWDFTKYKLKYNWRSFNERAVCGNEVTIRVVPSLRLIFGLLRGIRCFSDGNLMKFNEHRESSRMQIY